MWAVVVSVLFMTHRASSATVNRLDFYSGSSNGGTILRVFGTGFAENPLDETAGNRVYLKSPSQEYECDVEKDGTSETTITCTTRAMPYGVYFVNVEVNGVPASNPNEILFTVEYWSTPLLTYVLPKTSTPGALVTLGGRLFTDKTQSSEAAGSNGNTAAISRVWITGSKCDLRKETDELYGVQLDVVENTGEPSNWGSMQCLNTGKYIGSQNATFIVNERYGRSLLHAIVTRVSSDYRLYNHQTYAFITSVSPSIGSTHGGTLVTITGDYFKDSSIEIRIGGERCERNGVPESDTEITCTTSTQGSHFTDAFPGSRGVFVEIYEGLADKSAINGVAYEDYTGNKRDVWNDDATVAFNASTLPVVSRIRGFFIPGKDGTYSFWTDVECDIYISTDQTMANKASNPGEISLVAGEHYYFEVVNVENDDNQVEFSFKAYLQETDYTSNQTGMARQEKQAIVTHSPANNEIQQITLIDWENNESPTNEVLELCISCIDGQTCETIEEFYLTLHGINTNPLLSNSPDWLVKFWIEQFPALGGDQVVVELSAEPGNCISRYAITIQSARDHLPLQVTPVDPSRVSATITVATSPVPSLSSFTLSLNGVPSGHVTVGDTQSLAAAVKSIFGTSCPRALTSGIGAGLFFTDFEDGVGVTGVDIQGATTSPEDSYCGTHSLKNPTVFEYSIDASAAVEELSTETLHICYAHKGTVSGYLTMAFIYYDESGSTADRIISKPLILEGGPNWIHSCQKIKDLLDDVTISRIGISRLSLHFDLTDSDFFIDTMFVGEVYVAEADQVVLRGMRRPPLDDTVRLEDVSVTLADNVYSVEMTAYDCGIGLPLLEIAYATANEDGAYTKAAWGTSSITVQKTQDASPPIGGTFSVILPSDGANYGGTLDNIEWNVEAAELETRFEGLNGVSDVYVTRSGTCRGYEWLVEFYNPSGRQKEISVSESFEYAEADISASVITRGGLYFTPIPGDWIRVANKAPNVEITLNNVPSRCQGDCSFTHDESATPAVTGATISGNVVTIEGAGFTATTEGNKVTIGGVDCPVESAIETSIQCTLGETPGGTQVLVVYVVGKGNSNTFDVQVPFTITNINPSAGSVHGGTNVVITGTGFSSDVSVEIGGSQCTVSESTYTSISCVTGASTIGDQNVVVTAFSLTANGAIIFTFESSSAAVTGISPAEFSVIGGSLTISGSGFGDDSTGSNVFLGETSLELDSWSDTEIQATAPPLASGSYVLNVNIQGSGNADASGVGSINYVLSISNVMPQQSSLLGVNAITINGQGLGNASKVTVGENDCAVESAADLSVTCKMDSCGRHHYVRNDGTSADGTGYAWNPQKFTVSVGDEVTWIWSQVAGINGAAYQVFTVSSSSSVSYDNNGFYSGHQTSSGSFSYRFNTPGTYHIGGIANEAQGIFMRGTITVEDTADISVDITVEVGGYPVTLENAISCQTSLTPVVTSISPVIGTAETLITITGTGFVDGSTSVSIGDADCAIESSSETSVTCKLGAETESALGIYLEVSLYVEGKGHSRSDIQKFTDRHFVVQPFISTISPTSGSLNGGTTIDISGSGLLATSHINIGGIACAILTRTHTMVSCETSASSQGEHDVEVTVAGLSQDAICSGTCTFSYQADATPTLTGVSEGETSNGGATRNFHLLGQGFIDSDSATVHIGTTLASVLSGNDAEITIQVNDLPAGSHPVQLKIAGKGVASSDHSIEISPEISSISQSQGSVLGGTVIVITGQGFLDEATSVTVGSQAVSVTVASSTSISFSTPEAQSAGTVDIAIESNGIPYASQSYTYSEDHTPHITAITPSKGQEGDTVTLTFAPETAAVSTPDVMIGGAICSGPVVAGSEIECTIGSRYGGEAIISVNFPEMGFARIDSGVQFSYTFEVASISPTEGSLGGGQVVSISGVGMKPDATVLICDKPCELTSEEQTSTLLSCVTPAADTGTDQACDVKVLNSETDISTIAASNGYTYLSSLTPCVNSVTPTRGGTGGGTKLTISGCNLKDKTVTIDGVVCDIITTSSDTIECTTQSHSKTIQAKIVVMSDNGAATNDNAYFEYIDVWSSQYTWGNQSPPQNGEFVVIGKDQTVLLDEDTAILKMLLIQGGTLKFADEGDSIHLQAENILITDGGVLEIGTPDAPYSSQATITMHGSLRSPELPIYGAKTLGVRQGELRMHGSPIDTTWTLLASTAESGANEIELQIPVEWHVGDTIVIASTGLRHSQIENEVRKISAISLDKQTLTLDEPLDYRHLGITEDLGDGQTFEYRAEVGLLTRNIVFQGSNDIQWHDNIERCEEGFDTGMFTTQTCFQGRFGEEVGSDEFGASIMIHSASPVNDPDNADIVAHIEYVELNYVGQAFRLGRYPIHWHLMGDMSNSYVRGCAIHQSFNRAVTIHGTHNLRVQKNVIYNIMGGAFFIEDGIETGNQIEYNLAVFVKQSTSLLNDDVTPAAYWVTNPNNVIQHNHAAGGTHFGYWYRMHEHPDGPSFDASICQQKVPLGTFRNNTAHSQGWFGLWIFQKYTPMEGGSCGSSTTAQAAKFYSLTAWHCEKGAEWVEGGAIQFHDFKLSSNEDSAIDIKLVMAPTEWSKDDTGPLIKDTLIIGQSSQTGETYGAYAGSSGIILPFANTLWIDGVKFYNLNTGSQTALSVTSISGTCTSLCGGFYYLVQNLAFSNVRQRVRWRWEHEAVIYDLDGTFTGGDEGTKVVPHSAIYIDGNGDCIKSSDAKFSGSDICKPNVRFHRFAFNNIFPTSLEFQNVSMTNSFGRTSSFHLKKRITHKSGWMFLLRGPDTYTFEFEEGTEQFTNLSFTSRFYDFLDGDYLRIKIALSNKPDKIKLYPDDIRELEESQPITSDSANMDWHYDVNTREVEFIVGRPSGTPATTISQTSNNVQSFDVNLDIYRCFYPSCTRPLTSNTLPELTGPPNSTFPVTELVTTGCMTVNDSVDGKEVTIDEGCSVFWNIPQATVRVLHIKLLGAIFFQDESVTLTATYIINEGYLYAGVAENDPLTKNLHIILSGNHGTPEYETSNGLSVPPKCLACFGICHIHGKVVGDSWSTLHETANEGSTQLTLNDASWVSEGNEAEIIITTTGFNVSHTEKRTITHSSGNTVNLNQKLDYTHQHLVLAEADGLEIAPEVGLLTRSIKIESEDTSELEDESFGAFILVSSVGEYKALGKFSNIEFYRSGQEGFYDAGNPRHSISFLSAASKSEVLSCAFHDGFAPAIGTYLTHNTMISRNVIHHTVNQAIVMTGDNHILSQNLVTMNLFRGSYRDRFELTNFEYTAAINVEKTNLLTMTDNIIAGAERTGYRLPGQSCTTEDDRRFSGNVAKATLVGIWLEQTSSLSEEQCSLVHNFTIYKAWDYGIYHQTSDSVQIEECKIIDCTVGYVPLIFGPTALSHQYVKKYARISNSLVVGRSSNNDCEMLDEDTDKSLIIRKRAGVNKKAPTTENNGRIGILLPLFASERNGATFKSLIVNMNYPALYGRLEVTNIKAVNFRDSCGGKDDRLFYANPQNEDITHPIHVTGLTSSGVTEKNYVWISRPSTKLINPSDCVDMSCDGMRTILFQVQNDDIFQDGSLFSEAEWQWDGDNKAYGLGDYRVPKPMLTTTSGIRQDVSDIADGKGIARKDDCSFKTDNQAYWCPASSSSYTYRMLVIENLDADTETRRLSPLALLTDRYITIYNGPQDHGWCAGYTCQKRISTFYTIVPVNKHTDIYFTGTPPRNMKFHLLNKEDGEKITLGIWIPNPEDLLIYNGTGDLVNPNNLQLVNGKKQYQKPSYAGEFKPSISSAAGANFLDLTARILYLTLEDVVTVNTSEAIVVTFDFNVLTVDEFFGENLVNNLAAYLDIDESRIRLVDVVTETSRRKKRQTTDTVTYSVRITGDGVNAIKDTAKTAFQQGRMTIGTATPLSMQTTSSSDEAAIAAQDAALRNGEVVSNIETVRVPTHISLTTTPAGEELSALSTAPIIHLLDENDELVSTDETWAVQVSLDNSHASSDASATFSGTLEIAFTNGVANFADLSISHSGTYMLTFNPTGSASALPGITSIAFTISARTVRANINRLDTTSLTTDGSDLSFELELTDGSGNTLTNINHKGLTFRIEVSLDASAGAATLSGGTIFDFDSAGQISMSGLSLSGSTNYFIYNLNFRLFTNPDSDYDSIVEIQEIQIYPTSSADYIHEVSSNGVQIVMKFSQTYDDVLGSNAVETIQTAFHNDMVSKYPDVYFSKFAMGRTSDEKLQFTASITSNNNTNIDNFLEDFSDGGTLQYSSSRINLASTCGLTVDGTCYEKVVSNGVAAENNTTTIIVFAVLGACVMVSLIILITAYIMKRHKGAKVSALRCMDASPMTSRATTSSLDSLHAFEWGRATPDSTTDQMPAVTV